MGIDLNLTADIFQLTCPYNNPYQGKDKRLLFVCSAGLLRSATAANLFAKKGFNTRNCGTHEYALIPLSVNLIMWADIIYFMSNSNISAARETFKDSDVLKVMVTKSKVLKVPDNFEYNNPELIRLLEEQVDVA